MDNLFVENKRNNKVYKVYDITYNKAGYPHFLIYKDGEWLRLSAKNFRPVEEIAAYPYHDSYSKFGWR